MKKTTYPEAEEAANANAARINALCKEIDQALINSPCNSSDRLLALINMICGVLKVDLDCPHCRLATLENIAGIMKFRMRELDGSTEKEHMH